MSAAFSAPADRSPLGLRAHIPLAPLCTLGVGGPAQWFVEARDEAELLDVIDWAAGRGVPLEVLGEGSNVVVADEGIDGLVVKMGVRGISVREAAGAVELTAAAGEPWDELVGRTVERGWAGLECLSGIPGLVGATPIQNVGAYGQEVSDTVIAVRVVDRTTRRVLTLSRDDCGFSYRQSLFKSGAPGRYVVLSVTYRLVPDGAPAVRHAELRRHVESRGTASPSLAAVRRSVLAIRRAKSMVLEAEDPNRRSCGSFFLNPVVTPAELARIEALARDPSMPRWPEPDGRVKLSAAWLIEHAGFRPGEVDGAVGLSTRHSLAIVAHGGARARDVVAFARRVQRRVDQRFAVRLAPEPMFWGFRLGRDGLPVETGGAP